MIRLKLNGIVLVPCPVAILLACDVFAAYDLITFPQRHVRRPGHARGHHRIEPDRGGLPSSTRNRQGETLTYLAAQRHIVEACVYSADGKILAPYVREPGAPRSAAPALPADGIEKTSQDAVDPFSTDPPP